MKKPIYVHERQNLNDTMLCRNNECNRGVEIHVLCIPQKQGLQDDNTQNAPFFHSSVTLINKQLYCAPLIPSDYFYKCDLTEHEFIVLIELVFIVLTSTQPSGGAGVADSVVQIEVGGTWSLPSSS